MENGSESLRTWRSTSVKADTPCSVDPELRNEEVWKAKERKIVYTLVWRRQNRWSGSSHDWWQRANRFGLMRNCKETCKITSKKIEDFPYHLQLTKLCSKVGITKTVARWQYLTIFDDAELEKLGGFDQEYTLLQSDSLFKVKGWTRGNTKICSALEVADSHHQGRYGTEIMIQFFGWWNLFLGHDRHWIKQVRDGDDRRDPRRPHRLHWRRYRVTSC